MTVGIIGLGLIGGSIGLNLLNNNLGYTVLGSDSNSKHESEALRLGLVNEIKSLDDICSKSDLVIICIPVDSSTHLLNSILNKIGPNQVVTDVGSTKNGICKIALNHKNGNRFVGGHPIAGTEYEGPSAASLGLFTDKVGILCPLPTTDIDALTLVKNIYKSLKMTITEMDYLMHDKHLAYVSHLSHISSFALSLTVLNIEKNEKAIFDLAGSGFRSTSRLAKSSSNMWTPILTKNSDNILSALDEYINQLQLFRESIVAGDEKKINQLIINSNRIKEILG